MECVDDAKICSRADSCVTQDIWAEMKKAMGRVLESTTLADLVQRQREKGKSQSVMYHIQAKPFAWMAAKSLNSLS